ncbi:MAG: outer membrane beta-barrel protein [Planctomycetes bacterium]|nr:outer membrane beta-barrel protein [Planctomycetota bacterium]
MLLTMVCALVPQAPVRSVPGQEPEPLTAIREEIAAMRGDLDAMRREFAAPDDGTWRLFANGSDGVNVRGWVAQAFPFGASTNDGYDGPLTPNDKLNEYQLTEVYAAFEDAALFAGEGWSIGFRVDAVYGSDYRFLTSAGLESTWNTGSRYGVAVPNAHFVLRTGCVETRLGHFTSPVGFFAVGTDNNFFATVPYTFQYGEPFTHTGALAAMPLGDTTKIGLGVTNGWDSSANWNSSSGTDDWNRHVGAIATIEQARLLSSSDTFAGVFLWSQEPDNSGLGRSSRYLHTLVYDLDLGDGWRCVAQSDFGIQDNARVDRAPGRSNIATWYGLNQYLFLTLDGEWELGANLEWFRDSDGFRVAGATPSFGSPRATSFGRGPFAGNFYRAMLGAKWTPHPNVTIRPAVLFDAFDGERADDLLPFGSGADRTQLIGMIDLILRF